MADDLAAAIAAGVKYHSMVILADPTTGVGYVAGSPAPGPTTIAKSEDSPAVDGDVGIALLAVRTAVPIDKSGAEGDYEFLQIKDGRLWIRPEQADKTARLAASAASTNALRVSAVPCKVFGVQATCAVATGRWLVLYDSITTPPVPGTTPIRKKLFMPPNQTFAYDFAGGIEFATGLGYAIVANAADADATVVVANDILQLNIDYR